MIRSVILPAIEPMRLARLREPFSDPDWIFELKHDGFRALAYVAEAPAAGAHPPPGFALLPASRLRLAIKRGE